MAHLVVEQLDGDAALDEAREIFGVAGRHVGLSGRLTENLVANLVQQQTGRDLAVGRVVFNQGAGSQYQRLGDLFSRDAVVEVANRRLEDCLRVDLGTETLTGRNDQRLEALHVERALGAILGHAQTGQLCLTGFGCLLGALA